MSTPLVRLPPLDLLRGFVAVGRRMSITQAADDLCLTQSAISKQVRALEDHLGVRLLQRGHRSLAFTEEGLRLFRSANAALQQMQDVLAQFGPAAARAPVTVTSSTGVAGLWLLPRLGAFQQRHPGVDVRVAATNTVLDLAAQGIDLAIRYCTEQQAPRGAVRLFGETIAPVASPALRVHSLDSEPVLRRQVLLEFDDPRRPWLQWTDRLAAQGLATAQARGILRFNQYEQMIQAAVAGQGIGLGRLELLQPMLADGRLEVVPAKGAGAQASRLAYWLVRAQEEDMRADVRLLHDWLLAEATAA